MNRRIHRVIGRIRCPTCRVGPIRCLALPPERIIVKPIGFGEAGRVANAARCGLTQIVDRAFGMNEIKFGKPRVDAL